MNLARLADSRVLFRTFVLATFAALACFAPGQSGVSKPASDAAAPATDEPLLPAGVRQALAAGKIDQALAELERAVGKDPEQSDLARFARGVILFQAQRFAQAEQAFALVAGAEPASAWRYKALLSRAEALRELGRWAEAQALYEAEAQRLRSTTRQDELAGIYFAEADALVVEAKKPSPRNATEDLQRASGLYRKALALDLSLARVERALWSSGEALRAAGDVARAEEDWARYLIELDPLSKNRRGVGARVFEVRKHAADALRARADTYNARRRYEELSQAIAATLAGVEPWKSAYPALDEARRAALGELDGSARLDAALTWPATGSELSPLGNAGLARFLEAFPNHPRAFEAAFALAQRLDVQGRHEQAIAAFEALWARADRAGASEAERDESARLRASALFGKAQLLARQERFDAAIATANEYIARFPSGVQWALAQALIVNAEWSRGEVEATKKAHAAARATFARYLERHPLDARAADAGLRIAELFVAEANELEAKPDIDAPRVSELLREAVAQWRRVAAKYPGSNQASNALFQIGQLLEFRLADLSGAIAVYKECNFGPHAGDARSRLEAMTEPALLLSIHRTVRSGEKLEAIVDVRNVEKLVVELYRLDLEAYFRKHLTYEGVENLDLDLIAADVRLEVAVTGYAPHASIRQEIELPVDQPGTWAVAITGGELRATALAARSNLEIVTKQGQSEVIVFAEDALRVEPANDVRVFVCARDPKGGTPKMLEGRTDAQGLARLKLPAEPADPALAIFAERKGHIACIGLAYQRVQAARVVVPRGVVYTDRPAYRPGQRVDWRAIVRDAKDGRLIFEAGQKIEAAVVDARGRRLFVRELALSAFGTVHDGFELDPEAPQGEWGIDLSIPGGPAFRSTFVVADFELPRATLAFEFARPIWLRGELVTGKLRAQFLWGEPIAGSPIELSRPDGTVLSLSTDERGEVAFEFETRNFESAAALPFSATLAEESIFASDAVLLVTRGFQAKLTLSRDVVLVGDSVDVELATLAPDGEPVSQALKLAISRFTGQGGEVPVETRDLVSDAKTGKVSAAFAFTEGGSYRLRAEGSDRFGQPVVAEAGLFVSGQDDPKKLRFLVASHQARVGDKLALHLENKGDAALALFFVEANEIVEVRVVKLAKGKNSLELAIDSRHYPRCLVGAATNGRGEFHEDSTWFDVARSLKVEVTSAKETWAPGEEARLSVRVVDQLGAPVSAELSLAVVDAGIYERFPDLVAPLALLFEGGPRVTPLANLRSSATFTYQGKSTRIANAVLDEERRKKDRQEWDARREVELGKLASKGYEGGDDLAHPGPSAPGTPAPSLGAAFELIDGVESGVLARRRAGLGGRADQKARAVLEDGSGKGASSVFESGRAFWIPDLVTDAKGVGEARFALPERETRWIVVARGVDRTELIGEAETSFVTKSDFFVELRAPASLVEGDAPRILARVHNLTGTAGKATIGLRVVTPSGTTTTPVDLELAANGSTEHFFEAFEARTAGVVTLELAARATLGERTLEARTMQRLEVRPWGLELVDQKSAKLKGSTLFTLELDPQRKYTQRRLEIAFGPALGRLLVAEALGELAWLRAPSILPPTGSDAAAELLGVSLLLQALSTQGGSSAPDWRALSTRAEALLARVIALQEDGGGWPWAMRTGGMQPETSALSLAALAQANRAGLAVPAVTLEKGLTALEESARTLGQNADESKAQLLWALALHQRGDFALANRLHRERDRLSSASLAYLALALAEMGRAPMAAEVAGVLEAKVQTSGQGEELRCTFDVVDNHLWHRSRLEMTALALHALSRAKPSSERIAPAKNALLAARPWYGARARGLCLAALASFELDVQPLSERLAITARAGGAQQVLMLLAGARSGQLVFDLSAFADSKVPVELTFTGRGEPVFTAVLRGFTDDVAATTDGMRIRRHDFLTTPPRYRGREIPIGFGTVHDVRNSWENKVGKLGFGASLRCVIDASAMRGRDWSEDDFLVFEIPLPSGTRVIESSIHQTSWELRGDTLVVWAGRTNYAQIEFRLLGANPGRYRILPARVYSAYEPDRYGIGDARALEVMPRGVASDDPYRTTPDELYHLGLAAYEAGEFARARESLMGLWNEWEANLDESVLVEAASKLFFLALEAGEPREIVRFFEVLREKNPDLYVPFERVMAVGAAYRMLAEHERALYVFKALCEETFGRELKIVGDLESLGELDAASRTLTRLVREHGDYAAVVESELALCDKLLTWAPHASTQPSFVRAKRDRAALVFESIAHLQRFLVLHAQDPLAPEAGLNLVTAFLGLEDYARASALGAELAAQYPEPRFADAYLYSRAVAEWYLGHDDEARAVLERIAAAQYEGERGAKRPSQNRDLALYILAQIHHARQEMGDAARYYERVDKVFADAREALLVLREKRIELDEVVQAAPGGKVELPLRSKNIREAELLIYAVDLMTLYLREKNLSNITEVDLSGISPIVRTSVELGSGSDLRLVDRKVSLDLAQPGAYLVICRGDELHTSGLVLVSDLVLDVKEDAVSGHLRVQVLDKQSGKFARGVDVRVIGSQDGTFRSGITDPRGLFSADGVQGSATVIARAGDRRYAFFRGTKLLAVADKRRREPASGPSQVLDEGAYLKNVIELNDQAQQQRAEKWQQEVDRDRQGVQVRQVK